MCNEGTPPRGTPRVNVEACLVIAPMSTIDRGALALSI